MDPRGRELGVSPTPRRPEEGPRLPYAQPLVGILRFAPPEPVEPWGATRLVTDYGPSCPQPPGSVKEAVAEDCLTLNVFTPRETPAGGAPVMVFFHGGGFGTGGAAGYPSQWLSGPTQTVVVTVNYRLGPLGFRKVPGYHDEPLKGDRAGQRSIRLSRAYRAIYEIRGGTAKFVSIEEVNKHDY
jgi:para-nitrobenzyl esterase